MSTTQGYLPRADHDLLDFAENMNTKIAADPTAWGLTLAQQTAFDTLYRAFDSAMTTLQDPLTQSTPYVTAKNDARNLLINDENGIRKLVDIIQAYPETTNQMRSELRITIRNTSNAPVPPPTTKPSVTLTGVDNNTVYFSLRDEMDPNRRGKPQGVQTATILTYVGDEAPNDFNEWTFAMSTSKTTGTVIFPPTVAPLSKVWVVAAWANAKGQIGPFATARWTNLGGGVAADAA